MTTMSTLEDYTKNGMEINLNYCAKQKGPIILPPAPNQKYIDVYVEDNSASSSKVEEDIRRQEDYEAEVRVYRALEKLDEDIVVLHGFEFTHLQYRICDTSHVSEGCEKCKNAANIQGECDFIVIGRKYFTIIEVKNNKGKKKKQKGRKKAREQSENMISLIKRITELVGVDHSRILTFSTFPNESKPFDQNIDTENGNQMIWLEDFSDFRNWWKKNVTESLNVPSDDIDIDQHEKIKEILIAIWCTDKNKCDELKCSLGRSTMEIEEKLRKGRITFRSKNRPPNPNVIDVTDETQFDKDITFSNPDNTDKKINIFRDIIGVDYLTKEQVNAFNGNDNLLLLNGPAGSGKTIILHAQIIQWVKSNDQNRALLFIPTETESVESYSLQRYRESLSKAQISNVRELNRTDLEINITRSDGSDDKLVYEDLLAEKIVSHMEDHQVVIVMLGKYTDVAVNAFQKLIDGGNQRKFEIMVFIDDWQAVLCWQHTKYLQLLKQFSAIGGVRIVSDLTQTNWRYGDDKSNKAAQSFVREFPPENIATLSLNLRNTSDIADILSKIREEIVKEEITNAVKVFPPSEPGHFIHGPQMVVHVIKTKHDSEDFSLMEEIMNNEFDKLSNAGLSTSVKVGVVYPDDSAATTIETIVKERNAEKKMEVFPCRIDNSYSAEYPAVIVIDKFNNLDLQSLYLAISRARVYCTVILRPDLVLEQGVDHRERPSRNFLTYGIIADSVKIIRHYLPFSLRITTIEHYKKKGKEINWKYCDKEKRPTMLPPAPKHPYIDVYVDDYYRSRKIENEKSFIQAYNEAEVKVYRALEKLTEGIVVLHLFNYTHHQYRLVDNTHDRKTCEKCRNNCGQRQGGCKLLVIGGKYFIIMEVKYIPHEKNEEISEEKTTHFDGALRKSREQGKEVKSLIESITKLVGAEHSLIRNFYAFPNTSNALRPNIDIGNENQIIWAEDLLDFSSWWNINITENLSVLGDDIDIVQHEKIKEILLAIWCTDKNTCDELKCSLGRSIMDVDEQLRKTRISFRSKNRPQNPHIIDVTDETKFDANITLSNPDNTDTRINIFSDIIGVDYLPREHVDTFNRNENLLLINGPTGSGKTIILQAKLIQWVKSSEQNRALLFIPTETESESYSLQRYQESLSKTKISNVVLTRTDLGIKITRIDGSDNELFYEDQLVEKIVSCLEAHQVVIVMLGKHTERWFAQIISCNKRKEFMVFIDDWQAVPDWRQIEDLQWSYCYSIFEFAKEGRVWIACDFMQMNRLFGNRISNKEARPLSMVREYFSNNITTLSLNLRNTVDIADILSKIRKQIIAVIPETKRWTMADEFFPALQPGHYIHGPKIVVHVIEKKVDRYDLMVEIMNNELEKLSNAGLSQVGKVGILYPNYPEEDNATAAHAVERIVRQRNFSEMVCARAIDFIHSAEYPAAIVIGRPEYLDFLYRAISRARVYCVVILRPELVQRQGTEERQQPPTKKKKERPSENFLADEIVAGVKMIRHE